MVQKSCLTASRDAACKGKRPAGQRRTRPPPTPRARAGEAHLPGEEGEPSHPPPGTARGHPESRSPGWQGTLTVEWAPSPPPSALGRNSPPLPKVRRQAPQARSPWSRRPARGPGRCDGLKCVAKPRLSVLLRRPAGKGWQVRLHPAAAPLPPGRLRGRADWRLRERAERRLARSSPRSALSPPGSRPR